MIGENGMYPKHIYHHDLEREVTKHIEHEDHHPEWYDLEHGDWNENEGQEEFDYDNEDF